ncbi:hypothetical protein GQ55_4G124900 [Panicum hallii var. hallii]|uniref:Uncharacterized protein n=1 Tax=Panicum hallii var. hallii TaxID=1504633 RepID=A0A2T7DXY0_9POAL|nr:hypothetical protein GQ55_4G124900 [Panicum hallii var. hallii]
MSSQLLNTLSHLSLRTQTPRVAGGDFRFKSGAAPPLPTPVACRRSRPSHPHAVVRHPQPEAEGWPSRRGRASPSACCRIALTGTVALG